MPSLAAAALVLIAAMAPAWTATPMSSCSGHILSGSGVDDSVDKSAGDASAIEGVAGGSGSHSFDVLG